MLAFLAWTVSVCFLALAIWREGKRRSMPGVLLCFLLGVAFLVSVPITFIDPPRFVYFAIIEVTVLSLAARVWHMWPDRRAPIVALLALPKLGLRYGASAGWWPENDVYAACLNALFLLQCLVAGGLVNGLVARLGDSWNLDAAWHRRVHRHGEA